jgi:hypothetical protein
VVKRDAQGRKQVDLFELPIWAQRALALATVALVVGIALVVAKPGSGQGVPIAAIVGALIAFGLLAWRAQHR